MPKSRPMLTAAAALAALSFTPDGGLAQTTPQNTPPAAQPDAPVGQVQPKPAEPGVSAPKPSASDPKAQGVEAKPDVPLNAPLSKHLGQTGGVIKPPPTTSPSVLPPPNPRMDQEMVIKPPQQVQPAEPQAPKGTPPPAQK